MNRFGKSAKDNLEQNKESIGAATIEIIFSTDGYAKIERIEGNYPSIDGYIKLLNNEGCFAGKLEFQLKTAHTDNKGVKCLIDKKLVAYCDERKNTCGVLLLAVEQDTKRAFRFEATNEDFLDSLNPEQETFTIRFEEGNEILSIEKSIEIGLHMKGEKIPQDMKPIYYEPWLAICGKNDKRKSLSLENKGFSEGVLSVWYPTFTDKLSWIEGCLNKLKILQGEKKQLVELLESSDILLWHFIKISDGKNWISFLGIDVVISLLQKHNVNSIPYIVAHKICDSGVRISEFEQILLKLIDIHGDYYGPISAIIQRINEAEIVTKEFRKQIVEKALSKEAFHHPFVKNDIISSLHRILKEEYKNFVFSTIQAILSDGKLEENVTVGGAALALTFQANDLDNHVFADSFDLIGTLIGDKAFHSEAIDLLIKYIDTNIQKTNVSKLEINGIFKDNTVWRDASGSGYRKDIRYEYDEDKRYVGEMLRGLEILHNRGEIELIESTINKLLQKKYLTYFAIVLEFLKDHIPEYHELVQNIILNKEYRTVRFVRDRYLQNLIKSYFLFTTEGLEDFYQEVVSLHDEEAIAQLFIAVDDGVRTKDMEARLVNYSGTEKVKPSIHKHVTMTSFVGRQEPDLLAGKDIKEVYEILSNTYASSSRRMDIYHLSDDLGKYIGEDKKLAFSMLEDLCDKALHPWLIGRMVNILCDDVQHSSDALHIKIDKLHSIYEYAKVSGGGLSSVLDCLNHILRGDETNGLRDENSIIYEQLVSMLIELSRNSDPEKDTFTTVGGKETAMSGINCAINSIRGRAIEVLIVIAHFYPDEDTINSRIYELSDDTTHAVQANLLKNLKYLSEKNYDLCKKIIKKYETVRILSVDMGMIYYLAGIKEQKLDDVKIIFEHMLVNNSDKDIQKPLGELLGRFLCSGVIGYEDIIEKLVSKKIGTEVALGGCMDTVLHHLSKELQKRDFDLSTIKKYISHVKFLLQAHDENIEKDYMMHQLGVFVLRRNDLPNEAFLLLYKESFFDYLVDIRPFSVTFHHYLVDYIEKMVSEDFANIDEGIALIYKQLSNESPIYSDRLIADGIAKTCQICFDNKDKLSIETMQKVIMLYDRGLEVGFNDFYSLYEEYLQSGKIDITKYI